MALSDNEIIQAIITSCNIAEEELDGANLVIRVEWDLLSGLTPRLRYLKSKRAVLLFLQGQYRKNITMRVGGDQINWGEYLTNVEKMIGENDKDIDDEDGTEGPAVLSSGIPEYALGGPPASTGCRLR